MPHPIFTVQRGSRAQKETRSNPERPLCPRNSPTPDPDPSLRRKKQGARTGSRVQKARWEVECLLPRPTRRNPELLELGHISASRGLGVGADPAASRGSGKEAPGASASAVAVPRTSGSAATVATPRLQLSPPRGGWTAREGEGREGRGGAWLWVPCAWAERRRAWALLSGSAPKAACSEC